MKADVLCERYIACREGFVLKAYKDGKPWEDGPEKGLPRMSIGLGHQDRSVKPGDTITVPACFALLKADIPPRARVVSNWLKVPLLQHQFNALVSMYYQSGKKFLKDQGLMTLINAGHLDEALALFPEFDTRPDEDGNEVHDPNLKKRRLLEQKLFLTGDYGKLSPIPIWRNGFPGPYEWYHVQPGDFA